jgi:hypothetical protein
MKLLFYILIFFITGEIIFQIDFYINNRKINDIPAIIGNNKSDNKQSKIFLLGDSYTKGLGISPELRIANQLKIPGYRLLDSSHSGDNWANYISIIKNMESAIDSGDIIVIGVNWNDINFNTGSIISIIRMDYLQKKSNLNTKKLTENTRPRSLIAFVRSIYGISKLISVLSGNIQNLLKRKGMPLPIGDFHYFRTKAYTEKRGELTAAMQYIQRINNSKGINTILYLMPDFNLTKRKDYFKTFIEFFETFNNKQNLLIINGVENFDTARDGIYCISIQDGHPNGLAHKEIAKQISNSIFTGVLAH